MGKQVQIEVPVAWQYVQTVAQTVEDLLREFPEGLRKAASMVSAELVENAIKYGYSVPALQNAIFTLFIHDNTIYIEVKNGARDRMSVRTVQQRIRQIAAAENKELLYIKRMQKLMTNPKVRGQLGLYRIGCEGQFDLSSRYSNHVLTISATRGIK